MGAVLGKGHIPHIVQAVLDRPMPTDQVGEPTRAGLGMWQAGHRVHDHGRPPPGAQVADLADDLDDLRSLREPEPADRDGLEVRSSMRPWARSRVRSSTGTWCQASRWQRPSSVGWLALTVNR
jgi:hypothetical protein